MAFNGSGTYQLPGAALANGGTVSATEHNQFRNDVATALSQCVVKDGQQTITANLPMNSKKLTGLAAGTTAGDSVRYEQATSAVAITGGTINGTTVGGTTPAAGSFTSLSSTSGAFNGTVGETTPSTGAFTTGSFSGLLSANGGISVAGSASGFGGGEVRLTGGADSQNALSTTGTGAVSMIFDHRAAGNTGSFVWRNGTGGANELARLTSTGLSVTGALSASGWVTTASGLNVLSGANDHRISLAGNTLSIQGDFGNTGGDIRFYTNGANERGRFNSTGLSVTGALSADNSEATALTVKRSGGTDSNTAIRFQGASTSYYIGRNTSGGLGFSYNSADVTGEADMTLDSSGNLFLKQTSTTVADTGGHSLVTTAGGSSYHMINHKTGTASGDWYNAFYYGTNQIGSITQNGTTAVAYNTTSDHRLKENVRPANASRFNDIEFVDFEWVDGRHDCGVIAHQLQSVYPDLVIGEKDATEIRQVEITPAVTEQRLVSEAVLDDEGNEVEPAKYETVEVTPAVYEDQEFPVYQQVNYIGLIGRMGTRIQIQDKQLQAQAELISDLLARVESLEATK